MPEACPEQQDKELLRTKGSFRGTAPHLLPRLRGGGREKPLKRWKCLKCTGEESNYE